MKEAVVGCHNLSDLANQIDQLERISVLNFNLLMTVILTLGIMIIYYRRIQYKSLFHFMIVTSFVFYVLNVIRLTFFLMSINAHYLELLRKGVSCGIVSERRHNFQLFDFMKWNNLFHITTLGNFIMLMPLSFYLPTVFQKRKWGIFKVTGVGFLVSLTIECLQLMYDYVTGYAYRGFNVDDLLMNTLGVTIAYSFITAIKIIGYLLVYFWKRMKK